MKEIKAIHFIEYHNKVEFDPNAPSEFETGDWARISDSRAERLVGRLLYLHRAKVEPSWLGGRILGYRTVGTGRQRRRIFRVRRMVACFERTTSPDGWGLEQKTEYVGQVREAA